MHRLKIQHLLFSLWLLLNHRFYLHFLPSLGMKVEVEEVG